MFIGHFALGFAARKASPRLPLAMCFVAAQFADLLWPVLLALGIEQVRIDPEGTAFAQLIFVKYPYSHSLLALAAWGVLLSLLYGALTGQRRAAPVILALVLSHFLLDWVTHVPDLPLYPGGPKVGLGLWNSPPGTIAIEGSLFAAGVWIYARATRARDRIGRWAFAGLVALLLGLYVASIVGPPPPSVAALVGATLGGAALLLWWTVWMERHRTTAPPSAKGDRLHAR